MKLLTAICVAALVVAFCAPAFAETQSVKISGDINLWTLARRDFNLSKTADGNTTTVFMQQVGLNVDADLTDNVSTFVRVLNERDWDAPAAATMDILLDEAYVTLREFLYAPLTVTIGRQNLWFGKGLIVGSTGVVGWDPSSAITANEISQSTAFDAIRGTLDYNPWTIDLVTAKIDENTVTDTDDIDLYGVNVGYLFDRYEAEAEGYWFYKHDRSVSTATGKIGTSTIHTIGLRGSFVPYENMNIWAEGAYQDGIYTAANITIADTKDMDRKAYALDFGGDYQWVNTIWTPKLGVEYILYSGAKAEADTDDWEGWDSMYRGKFDSQIREYQNVLYNTAFDNASSRARNSGVTNQHQVVLMGTVDPMTDVVVDANVNFFWLQNDLDVTVNSNLPAGAPLDNYVGTELDAAITYDYTEDVSFVVAGGIFWPGDVYPNEQDDSAKQITARCAVEF